MCSFHIHDSDTQSRPLRLLHILVMTNTHQCSRTPWLALTLLASRESHPSNVKVQLCAQVQTSEIRAAFFFFSTLCILLYSSIFNQPSFASIPEVSWENESYFLEQRLWAPGNVIMATQRIFCVTLSGVQQSGVLHRVESAPTIWSGGPTQSPRLVLSCFGKDLLWIPSFSSGLNGTSL